MKEEIILDSNFKVAMDKLDVLKDKLALSDVLKEKAVHMYKKIIEKNTLKGRSIDAMVAAVIYVACRDSETSHNLNDITEATGLRKKSIPNNDQLVLFYSNLNSISQMIFLTLVTSGLRIGEVLSLDIDDVDFEINMIDASKIHKSHTKSSWISFITHQVSELIQIYVESLHGTKLFPVSYKIVQENFQKASKESGIKIKPHLLRTIFTEKCTQAGIEEKYIDAFCGRMSQNIIRKHYTDYSPEAMRRHYDKVEPFLRLSLE
ncbi:MAG: tyrosine-type recombinase/integrase [Thaumarchaeota archaeon]|nr:tyrosine-type recombinase/integrase [Nitrososphaerota archaeon]